MEPHVRRSLGLGSLEERCPRCGRLLRAIHTGSQYGRQTVALLELSLHVSDRYYRPLAGGGLSSSVPLIARPSRHPDERVCSLMELTALVGGGGYVGAFAELRGFALAHRNCWGFPTCQCGSDDSGRLSPFRRLWLWGRIQALGDA